MKRQPIPRFLLPHRATLRAVETDAWQNPVEKDAWNMEYIRIDAELTRSAGVKDISNTAGVTDTYHAARWVLFFDCRNSLPLGISFAPGQEVLWRDMRLTVVRVLPVCDDQSLHHYEVELEGG